MKVAAINVICITFIAGQTSLAQRQDDAFFDNTIVQEIYIDLPESDWKTLRDNYLQDTYYSSNFRWNDVTVQNIAIRSRGSGSRSPEKPNLRINFNRNVSGQRFLGLSDVTLKANNQDYSMIRETASFALMRRMGIAAPREAPVRLFINGEFFGLYTIVEMINEDFLSRVFQKSDGYLYEYETPTNYYFDYLGADPSIYLDYFSPETNEDEPDIETLIEMIRVVNFASDEEFESAVTPYVNLEQFMKITAAQNYLSDGDGILSDVFGMNNFYLHRLRENTQFVFLPWDMDLSFGPFDKSIVAGIDKNILARRAFQVPRLRQIYFDSLALAAATAGAEGGWLEKEMQRQHALITEDAKRDIHKQCMTDQGIVPCTFEDFQTGLALATYPGLRTSHVLDALSRIPPAGPPQLTDGGIVGAAANAASLAPGSLATLYGSALALTINRPETQPLPTLVDGVSISINETQVPLSFVSPSQVNFQVPWNVEPGTARVVLSSYGQQSNVQEIEISRVAPAVFSAHHADSWDAVSASKPAAPGETIVLYATGLGAVSPPLQDGAPGASDQPSIPVETVEVKVGESAAAVEFCGITSGLVGVFQLNVRLPEAAPPAGESPLTITVGGQTSPEFALPLQ